MVWMFSKQCIAFVILISVMHSTVYAKDKNDDYQYGGYVSLATVSVDDPNGSGGNASGFNRLGAIWIAKLNRRTLFISDLSYMEDTLKAKNNMIGQDVDGLSMSAQYLKRFQLSRQFQPFLGLGTSLTSYQYSQRHTIDAGGFLNTRFDDREGQELNISLVSFYEFDIKKMKNIFVRLSYEQPIKDGVKGFYFDSGFSF